MDNLQKALVGTAPHRWRKNMLYEMKNMLTSETIYFKHFLSCLRFSKTNPCLYIVENMKTGRKYWIRGINAQTYKLGVYHGITA